MRGTARVVDVSLNTVAKLLLDAGNAATAHHHERVRAIEGERTIECDEIWSYVYANSRTSRMCGVSLPLRAACGHGELWSKFVYGG